MTLGSGPATPVTASMLGPSSNRSSSRIGRRTLAARGDTAAATADAVLAVLPVGASRGEACGVRVRCASGRAKGCGCTRVVAAAA